MDVLDTPQLGHSCCEGLGRTRSLDIPPGPDLCLELGLPTGRVVGMSYKGAKEGVIGT